METTEGEPASELASFREQWRREVQARNDGGPSTSTLRQSGESTATSSRSARHNGPTRKPASSTSNSKPATHDRDEDYVPAPSFDDVLPDASGPGRPARQNDATVSLKSEPVSALDHYEKAVEKEALGNLGDSLNLYRKAYRMDSAVDQTYKAKHFPPPLATKTSPEQEASKATAPPADAAPVSMKDLIASFASASLQPTKSEVEGMPQPRSPITGIPDEILVHILQDVAVLDIGDFVRLAQVCKRLAYLVSTENRIWRRVCLEGETGFGGMHHQWQVSVLWGPPEDETIPLDRDAEHAELPQLTREAQDSLKSATTLSLYEALYASSWQRMFRSRPRIRFNGCYISTVNYIRAGQSAVHQISWTSNPVHIVTYYRYLRFFRDGTLISLLTTAEPPDVVHHLTKDALALHRASAMTHLPSALMQQALMGRWRLSSSADYPDRPLGEVEGDVFIETEGIGKYIYRMELSLRTAGKGARHNKLVWRGFYSYNKLTDDWGEFGLKHDRNFFFSRVKSYGIGE
jgi:F-box protein 9